MKTFYIKPELFQLWVERFIAQSQSIHLAVVQAGSNQACGALQSETGKKSFFGNTALFCTDSPQDLTQQLTGSIVTGCGGHTATIVTGQQGFACIDAKAAFEQIFGDTEPTQVVKSCPGMAYLCTVQGFQGSTGEAISSVGDFKCPSC